MNGKGDDPRPLSVTRDEFRARWEDTFSCRARIEAAGVTLRNRATHWLWSRVGRGYWMTIGRTIWYPADVERPASVRYSTIIDHELVHVRQQRAWGRWLWLWLALYVLAPLPAGLAWFRWRAEREAYLLDIQAGVRTVDESVAALWRYGWCWPRCLMRRWFVAHMPSRK